MSPRGVHLEQYYTGRHNLPNDLFLREAINKASFAVAFGDWVALAQATAANS